MDPNKDDAAVAAPKSSSTPSSTETTTTTTTKIPPNPLALPLDWTRIQRKRPRLDGDAPNTNSRNDMDVLCCDDPTCSRTGPAASFRGSKNGVLLPPPKSVSVKSPPTTTVSGKVVFCLPEANPSWFQGYLFLRGCKPWGLLAVQTDLDECLQCADGGYRQVKLQVSTYSGDPATQEYSFDTIEWTGGDMMRLESATCRMIPSQFLTDRAAVPHCESIFGSLLRKLRLDDDSEGVSDTATSSSTVLDLMPDVAVIVGTMELVVPASAVRHLDLDIDDDDDGLF
jgi:hypothetical protein